MRFGQTTRNQGSREQDNLASATGSSSSTSSTSRRPFQFAPVPARYRRHLERSQAPSAPSLSEQSSRSSTEPSSEQSSEPASLSSSLPSSLPTSLPSSLPSSRPSSLHNSNEEIISSDSEGGDEFDEFGPNPFRFSRRVSSGYPLTPTTPLTPLTPSTPHLYRPDPYKRRKSGLSAKALAVDEPVITTTTTLEQASQTGMEEILLSLSPILDDHVEPIFIPTRSSSRNGASIHSSPANLSGHTIQSYSEFEPQPDLRSEPLRTLVRANSTHGSSPAQTVVENPFADTNEAVAIAPPIGNPFLLPKGEQPIDVVDMDRDIEKTAMATHGEQVAISQDQFPDYAPLVQSRVDAGRWGLMLAVGALNMALIIVFLFFGSGKASMGVMVALKGRDILSVLWQSLLFVLALISRPFRRKREKVVHPPRKIVSLVPVYKESTQDVLDTVDSIITDNAVRPQDFNIIAIMADGFDVEDDVIVQESVCRVEDSPYFSWKIRESAFRVHFGFRMGHPIMIVRKVKNAGKKDSLIFAFDLFNSDNEATGYCNSEARAMLLDYIRRLYNQPDLQSFDFIFCTDADTKILAGSVNVLADRLMDEGEQTVGACGIVEADFEKPGRSLRTCGLWYFWDHFQGFQYTYGQWVRRRSESSWGRVTCMPGAITMLRTGAILGQATAEYRKHIQNGNLIKRQVQYQGTDRRLCWSIISRSKSVRTVLETRAACFTIPPQSLSHYLSQRRRWGSNAYFNAFITLTGPNQHFITRLWMTLELTRSTLVFFRIYNFGHFVYNLVTKFQLLAFAPLLAITLLPQMWFLFCVVLPTKRYRPLLHHYLYGAVLNRLCSVALTPTVYANVLLGFGDFRWGKSHTGANAANKPPGDAAASAMERGESSSCDTPREHREIL